MISWQSMQLRLKPSITLIASSFMAVKRGLVEISSVETLTGSAIGMPDPLGTRINKMASTKNMRASNPSMRESRVEPSEYDRFIAAVVVANRMIHIC